VSYGPEQYAALFVGFESTRHALLQPTGKTLLLNGPLSADGQFGPRSTGQVIAFDERNVVAVEPVRGGERELRERRGRDAHIPLVRVADMPAVAGRGCRR
jgi:hypothetical protein